MTQEKTLWKKNLDSKYIKGEDLQEEFNGLKKEMVVTIVKAEDASTFDQNSQKEKTLTALWFKDVYKPVLVNKTNSIIIKKLTGSIYVEDCIGHTIIMFAQAHKRFGYVVAFKPYVLPHLQINTKEFTNCHNAIHRQSYKMDDIRKRYQVSTAVEIELMKQEVANA